MKLKNFTAVLLGVFLWAVCICSFSSVAEATGYIPKGEKNKASSSWKKNNTASADYQLNIGLANGVVQASVGMNSEYTVLDMASGSVLGRFKGNVLSVITVSGNRLAINGKKVNSQSVVLKPINKLESNAVIYNGNKYRGALNVKINKSGSLLVLNNVTVDDYLMGTVPSEMSPSWSKSALEAQAVAARTYALYTKNQHSSEGYDLCTSTHCQVYSGIAKESPSTTLAVKSTQGYVMTYGGKPICAVFHSSSGGRTENAENVWGHYNPYLRSVADEDNSPNKNWTVSFTSAEMQKLLARGSKDVGAIKSVQMVNSSDRSAVVRFKGTKGTIDLSGVKLRSLCGLKSSMFTVRSGGRQIIFDGHGYGHGLGMSQYGAKAMAEKGKSWQDILKHYYTDISIDKMY